MIAARAPPIGVQVQDGELLEAKIGHGVACQQRLLIGLAHRGAPHEVAPFGEIRMRIGEAELHQACALIDRRCRHRRRTREIAELHDDLRIRDEFLGDRHRLARVALTIFKGVGELAPVDAACGLNFIQRQIETLLPLRTILRVWSRQRAADTEHDGVGRLRESAARHCRSCHEGSKRAFDQATPADVSHLRLHPF